jgi:hypothetical protein
LRHAQYIRLTKQVKPTVNIAVSTPGVVRQQNTVMSPAGLGTENDCADKAQKQFTRNYFELRGRLVTENSKRIKKGPWLIPRHDPRKYGKQKRTFVRNYGYFRTANSTIQRSSNYFPFNTITANAHLCRKILYQKAGSAYN